MITTLKFAKFAKYMYNFYINSLILFSAFCPRLDHKRFVVWNDFSSKVLTLFMQVTDIFNKKIVDLEENGWFLNTVSYHHISNLSAAIPLKAKMIGIPWSISR